MSFPVPSSSKSAGLLLAGIALFAGAAVMILKSRTPTATPPVSSTSLAKVYPGLDLQDPAASYQTLRYIADTGGDEATRSQALPPSLHHSLLTPHLPPLPPPSPLSLSLLTLLLRSGSSSPLPPPPPLPPSLPPLLLEMRCFAKKLRCPSREGRLPRRFVILAAALSRERMASLKRGP